MTEQEITSLPSDVPIYWHGETGALRTESASFVREFVLYQVPFPGMEDRPGIDWMFTDRRLAWENWVDRRLDKIRDTLDDMGMNPW